MLGWVKKQGRDFSMPECSASTVVAELVFQELK
jgi:hypothetical protein